MPELTVVIPTKDRPEMLRRAAASVLQQVEQVELIVVDDGSTRGNAESIAAFCRTDQRIRLLRNEQARGAPHGRNLGLAASRGLYWTTLDDDDIWLSGKWAHQRTVLERYGFPDDLVVVMAVRDPYADIVLDILVPLVRGPERLLDLGVLMRRVPVAAFHKTFVAPTALVRELGGYDERLVWGEHTDALIRLSKIARFAAAEGVGTEVDRRHGNGESRVGRDWSRRTEGIRLLLDKHSSAFSQEPALRTAYLHVLGIAQLQARDRWGAARTFLRIIFGGTSLARRARALAHLMLTLVGGRPLWRLASRAAGHGQVI